MDEKIVIVVEKTGKRWFGHIYGQVGDKSTEQKETVSQFEVYDVLDVIYDAYVDKVLEWMEQLK